MELKEQGGFDRVWYQEGGEIIMILAGDIGGTKTVLAPLDETSSPTAPAAEETYPGGQCASFVQIVDQFLQAVQTGSPP